MLPSLSDPYVTQSLSAAQNDLPADYCKDMPRGGYKRHLYDCSKYVSCWSMKNFYVQNCQEGLLYDEATGTCNYAALVNCGRSPSPYTTPAPTFSVTNERSVFTSRRRPQRPQNTFLTRRTHAPSRGSVFSTITRTRKPKVAATGMVHAVHEEDLSKFVHAVIHPKVQKPKKSAGNLETLILKHAKYLKVKFDVNGKILVNDCCSI